MTETMSNVYDLVYPSPITLKEISSIVIVGELWRKEISGYLKSKRSHGFNLTSDISLKNVIPDMPSRIYDLLEEYIATFRKSIVPWLSYHSGKVFIDRNGDWNNILSSFHDFVWDWNGTIHYASTAKRMMLCDRLADYEKFKIACLYCFEDDIKLIWPSVSTKIELNEIDFYQCPQLYHWICYLRNELHKVPNPHDEPIDEVMFSKCDLNNLSSLMYFWNRLSLESQSRIAIDVYSSCSKLIARFILPRLNERQLEEFVAKRGGDLICTLLIEDSALAHVLPTWMYIRNKINESNFTSLVEELLSAESIYFIISDRSNCRSAPYLCCEIWKSAPQHLKQSAVNNVLSREPLFSRRDNMNPFGPREMTFLITILSDASFEQRNAFWRTNWRHFVVGVRLEHLSKVMKLCFRNENEMTLFKENTTAKYENIYRYCVWLLETGDFEELTNFLSFCCPDAQKRSELKRRLLRSNYLGDSILRFRFLRKHKLLNELIDDAFRSADLRVEFIQQFISTPANENYLFQCVRDGSFVLLMEFVDTIVSDERVLVPLKKRLFDHLKECLIAGTILEMDDNLQRILIWLLGNENEVDKFKQSVSLDDILRNMPQSQLKEKRRKDGDMSTEFSLRNLRNFLIEAEEVEKYKQRFPDELNLFVP